MQRCTDCGHIFDEYDAITIHEYMGEFWGTPAYEDWMGCPNCKSTEIEDYDEREDEEDD